MADEQPKYTWRLYTDTSNEIRAHYLRTMYLADSKSSTSFGFVEQVRAGDAYMFRVKLNWTGTDVSGVGGHVSSLEEGMRIVEALERNSR